MSYVHAASGTYAIVHPQSFDKKLWRSVVAFRIDDEIDEIIPVFYPSDDSFHKDSALLFPDGRVFWRGEYYDAFPAWRCAAEAKATAPVLKSYPPTPPLRKGAFPAICYRQKALREVPKSRLIAIASRQKDVAQLLKRA